MRLEDLHGELRRRHGVIPGVPPSVSDDPFQFLYALVDALLLEKAETDARLLDLEARVKSMEKFLGS